MSFKEKIVASKPVQFVVNSKSFSKAVDVAGAATLAVGTLMTTASATEAGTIAIAEINSGDILNNASPFINAALPILCVVGGLKLGIRFLKGAIR